MDNDMVSPMYATLELINSYTKIRQEADENLKTFTETLQKYYDQRARFAPFFRVDDYVFLERPRVFLRTVEWSASEIYDN